MSGGQLQDSMLLAQARRVGLLMVGLGDPGAVSGVGFAMWFSRVRLVKEGDCSV